MLFIYALQLEKKKYYIGKTTNSCFTLESHCLNSWTKFYRPIRLVELVFNGDETKYIEMYGNKYGTDNVYNISSKCFVCASSNHYAKDCIKDCMPFYNNDEFEENTDLDLGLGLDLGLDSDSNSNSNSDSSLSTIYEDTWICQYCDIEFTDKDNCEYHEKQCKSRRKNYKQKLSKKTQTINICNCCFNCGRDGHYTSACLYKTDVKGASLK